jgi:hypothetical protein
MLLRVGAAMLRIEALHSQVSIQFDDGRAVAMTAFADFVKVPADAE